MLSLLGLRAANWGQQPIMTASERSVTDHVINKHWELEAILPVEHSMIVQSVSHIGSGVVGLPSLIPIWTTRIVEKAMHIKPEAKSKPIPSFWRLAICRFQISRIGRNMTVSKTLVSFVTYHLRSEEV